MTSPLPRFTSSELHPALVTNDGYNANIPALLNDRQLLRSWSVLGGIAETNGLVDEAFVSQIQEASYAIEQSVSDPDYAYTAWKPETYLASIEKILAEVRVMSDINPALVELLEAEIAKRSTLGNDAYVQKVETMNEAVYLPPVPLYVAGENLRAKHSRPVMGFGGKLFNFVMIDNPKLENPGIEPVVEGIDGSAGLFPPHVYFKGVYAVQEVLRAGKKDFLGLRNTITPEEKEEMEKLPIDWKPKFEIVDGVFRPVPLPGMRSGK